MNKENQNETARLKKLITKSRSDAQTSNKLYINKNQKKSENSMSMNEILSLVWGAKEILRGDFKKTEWGSSRLSGSFICAVLSHLKTNATSNLCYRN